MIEIEGLTKSFKKNRVIDALSASFSSTGVSVIVGTNGSGKTTLLNMLTNLLEADGGSIQIDGISPGSQAYKSKFFYLPSDFYLPGYMTGKEYVQFVLSRYETSEEEKASLLIELLDLADGQHKTIESYSFGMKKKIQIVAAVAANTDYIIADEIFGGYSWQDATSRAGATAEVLYKHYVGSNDMITPLFCPCPSPPTASARPLV